MSKVLITESNLSAISNAIRAKLGVVTAYKPGEMAAAIASIDGYPEPTGTVNITQNGTANVKDYAAAAVSVPNRYAAADEGKVVSNGALVSQTSRTVTENGTVDTTLNNSLTVNVSGGGGSANILSGTAAPTSAQGSDGDIYLQYYADSSLPDGFTSISTLSVGATAGAFISLGVLPADISAFELKYRYTSESAKRNNNGVFGAGGASRESEVQYYNNAVNVSWGGNAATVPFDTQWHIIKLDSGSIYIDEERKMSTGTMFASIGVCLFAFSYNSTLGMYSGDNIEIRYFNFTTANVEHSLVPAKRNSDGVLGMYDVMNDVFYTNAGTQLFIGGATNSIIAVFVKVNGAWVSLIGANINDVITGD